MRKLIIEVVGFTAEIDVDELYGDGPLDSDSLYDGIIHEIVTQPDYTWKVVDADGNEVEVK